MIKIIKICKSCGSSNVVRDAWASWNKDSQKYELESIFDKEFCNNCEGETTIIDKKNKE